MTGTPSITARGAAAAETRPAGAPAAGEDDGDGRAGMVGRRPLERHCRFVTRDLDEARAQLARFWERHEMTLRHGRSLELRCHQVQLGRVSLKYYETAGALHVTCGPVQDALHVLMVEAGKVTGRTDHRDTAATRDVAVVQAPGQYLELDVEPHRSLVLSVDRGFAARALAQWRPGGADWPPHELPLAMPAVSTLRSFCRWLADELDRPDTPILTSPSAAAHCERLLLSMLAECLQASRPEQRRRDRLSAKELAALEDWLHAHCTDPIGVEDLATVAGVSVGAVREGFRRLRGCSAREAVRLHRLDHVRRLLLQPTPQTTVTSAAFDAGFFHLGRFAAHYARRFGERPAETLAAGRSRSS